MFYSKSERILLLKVILMQHNIAQFLAANVLTIFPLLNVFLPLRGVNVVPFLEMIGLPESLVGLLRNSSSGYALTAYAMYKVISSRILWVFIEVNN